MWYGVLKGSCATAWVGWNENKHTALLKPTLVITKEWKRAYMSEQNKQFIDKFHIT